MIFDNIQRVRERIAAAASRAGRTPESVELMAVTKYAAVEDIAQALNSGLIHHIGESRVQDAVQKREKAVSQRWPKVTWRMIGHLQTNKAKKALELFDAIDSLDSLNLAETLDNRLAETGNKLPVLIQVKLTERETQSGITPDAVKEFAERCGRFPHLQLQGLMAIGPAPDPVEKVRPYFRKVRELSDQILRSRKISNKEPWIVSMGMSRDFEIAVEEGATMVRIGSALFDFKDLSIAGKHSKGGQQ